MSTRGVIVGVETDAALCPLCAGPTEVQKSARRNVVTIEHGTFVARETVRVCAARCRHPSGALLTLRSDSLSRRVPAGAVYGYDVEVFVGLARFVHHRQRKEIRAELSKEHGITLSSGEVSTLARRFLEHLAELHACRQPALREVLEGDGGYPLHFDATGEDGRGTLFVAYAGWRKWVLGAWKLPTERADQITPCLLEVAERFGPPCALMRDLGRAACAAAKNFVRKRKLKIPVLGCHLHFLSDIGKDLLKRAHDELRGLVRQDKLRPGLRALVRDLGRKLGTDLPALREEVLGWAADDASEQVLPESRAGLAAVRALAQWVLDSARDGKHLGFPFEQPYLNFYERARKARRAVDSFLRRLSVGLSGGSRACSIRSSRTNGSARSQKLSPLVRRSSMSCAPPCASSQSLRRSKGRASRPRRLPPNSATSARRFARSSGRSANGVRPGGLRRTVARQSTWCSTTSSGTSAPCGVT